MPDFKEHYRRIYATLGYGLTPEDGFSEAEITAMEEQIGIRLPLALRDYYLIAGNEPRFNRAHNRLLLPKEWCLDAGSLLFMEENQVVVLWGISANSEQEDDPPVFQRENEPQAEWIIVHDHCSIFLSAMMHWQGVLGGMNWFAEASATVNLVAQLEQNWAFAGKVDQMRAYNRQGQAVCLVGEGDDIPGVFAGAHSKADLDAIASNLSLEWEEYGGTEV